MTFLCSCMEFALIRHPGHRQVKLLLLWQDNERIYCCGTSWEKDIGPMIGCGAVGAWPDCRVFLLVLHHSHAAGI